MKKNGKKYAVLFVCTGNICRSPTAEAFFRYHVAEEGLAGDFLIDSAATQGFHVGSAPDNRAQAVLQERGIDMSAQRARLLVPEDFQKFDLIVAMDNSHMDVMRSMQAKAGDLQVELSMFLTFAPHVGRSEVPDPYYGGQEGFYHVMEMIDVAARGLLTSLQSKWED